MKTLILHYNRHLYLICLYRTGCLWIVFKYEYRYITIPIYCWTNERSYVHIVYIPDQRCQEKLQDIFLAFQLCSTTDESAATVVGTLWFWQAFVFFFFLWVETRWFRPEIFSHSNRFKTIRTTMAVTFLRSDTSTVYTVTIYSGAVFKMVPPGKQ